MAPGDDFLPAWREGLLDWARRLVIQRRLRMRTERPALSCAETATGLRLPPRPPYTKAGVRNVVQRARELFVDQQIEEVARSLDAPTAEELEQ